MISVILVARNEKYLDATLRSLSYTDTVKQYELVVVLDGEADYSLENRPNLKLLKNPEPQGIRISLNEAVKASRGDYLLKLDAHCTVAPDFIETLATDYLEKTVMVARRYTLDLETMQPVPRAVDYFYLSCPWTYPRGFPMMQSCPWISRESDKKVDELMCFQGSMWFMSREHWNWLGGLDESMKYAEHHEISFKTWLGGRRVLNNKNTWYAHPKVPVSGYRMSMSEVYRDHETSARYWTKQGGFSWLIDRFWPLPTEAKHHRLEKYVWPEDWRKYVN